MNRPVVIFTASVVIGCVWYLRVVEVRHRASQRQQQELLTANAEVMHAFNRYSEALLRADLADAYSLLASSLKRRVSLQQFAREYESNFEGVTKVDSTVIKVRYETDGRQVLGYAFAAIHLRSRTEHWNFGFVQESGQWKLFSQGRVSEQAASASLASSASKVFNHQSQIAQSPIF